MAEEGSPQTAREAVGVFHDASAFQDALDALTSAGFDRADLSLLASDKAIEDKLGTAYRRLGDLEASTAGCSTQGMCPAPRISSNRLPGISAAVSRTRSGGVAPSSSPQTARQGSVSRPVDSRRSVSRIAAQVPA
jgi:hypothetical protein